MGLGGIEPPTSPLSGVRSSQLSYRPKAIAGGAGRDRTGDLLSANQALSQLSYSPWMPPSPSGGNQSRPVGCRDHESSSWPLRINSSTPEWRSERAHRFRRSENGGSWSGTAVPYSPPVYTQRIRLSETPPTFSLRKEVIQPQVLLRLPCYDFTPIMDHTLGRCPPCGSACRLLVQSTFVM